MRKYAVLYEAWQMRCCGIPFAEGDRIKWLVCKVDLLNTAVDIGEIDYCYEAHSSEWNSLFMLEGRVKEIKILYEEYMPSRDNMNLLVPVRGKLVKTQNADGFDEKLDDMKASAYIVQLDECTIRPAKKEEVTFC